eukprot:1248216-Amphidinium_carterae.1
MEWRGSGGTAGFGNGLAPPDSTCCFLCASFSSKEGDNALAVPAMVTTRFKKGTVAGANHLKHRDRRTAHNPRNAQIAAAALEQALRKALASQDTDSALELWGGGTLWGPDMGGSI